MIVYFTRRSIRVAMLYVLGVIVLFSSLLNGAFAQPACEPIPCSPPIIDGGNQEMFKSPFGPYLFVAGNGLYDDHSLAVVRHDICTDDDGEVAERMTYVWVGSPDFYSRSLDFLELPSGQRILAQVGYAGNDFWGEPWSLGANAVRFFDITDHDNPVYLSQFGSGAAGDYLIGSGGFVTGDRYLFVTRIGSYSSGSPARAFLLDLSDLQYPSLLDSAEFPVPTYSVHGEADPREDKLVIACEPTESRNGVVCAGQKTLKFARVDGDTVITGASEVEPNMIDDFEHISSGTARNMIVVKDNQAILARLGSGESPYTQSRIYKFTFTPELDSAQYAGGVYLPPSLRYTGGSISLGTYGDHNYLYIAGSGWSQGPLGIFELMPDGQIQTVALRADITGGRFVLDNGQLFTATISSAAAYPALDPENPKLREKRDVLTCDWAYRGDVNCDGSVDFADITPFVIALQGNEAFTAIYPTCHYLRGDMNEDGDVTLPDINLFIDKL